MGIRQLCTPGLPDCDIRAYPAPKRDRDAARFGVKAWGKHDLAVDQKFAVPISNVIDEGNPGDPVYADMIVVISYEIPLIHWKREKIYPLHIGHQASGVGDRYLPPVAGHLFRQVDHTEKKAGKKE
jgi:hypothetical protein